MSPERENKAEACPREEGAQSEDAAGRAWGRGPALINVGNDRSDFGLLVGGLPSSCREAGEGPGDQPETEVGRLRDAGVTTFRGREGKPSEPLGEAVQATRGDFRVTAVLLGRTL